jgi:plasmid maintenance system antidote protein VapI
VSHVDDDTKARDGRRDSDRGVHGADGFDPRGARGSNGVARKHVNELCNDRRTATAPTALILARVFGNSPEFWLNGQRRTDLWEAMHSPTERKRIERARPLKNVA